MTDAGTTGSSGTGGSVRTAAIAAGSGVEVALLDPDGVIVAVNDAWVAFGAANGADPGRSGVGTSYLDACDEVPADPFARAVASALRTALGGDLPAPVQVAVPCHGPGRPRWFDVLVSSRFDDTGTCLGATVTLSLVLPAPEPSLDAAGRIRRRPGPDPVVPAYDVDRSERLGDAFAQMLLDRAPLGILVVDDLGNIVRAGRGAEQLFGHPADGLTGMPIRRLLPELDPFDRDQTPGAASVGTTGPTLQVDGILADGSVAPLEIRLGRVPLSRGTGAVVLLRDAASGGGTPPSDQVLYRDHEIAGLARGLDAVVRHLFTSGLTLVAVAGATTGDDVLAGKLLGVTEDLDRAVREIRSVAFRLQQEGRRTPSSCGPWPDAVAD